ncbi:MAG TPA: hypothetical protein VM841_12465, partial [Actinomycetota bacterium]|nr:hypothetical protein [Actinomycetota bacterium]
FSWDRTAQTPESAYGLEVMRAGIPGDVASSGRPGIECAAADPNDLEPPRTVAGRSHQWGRFADSGGRATRIPSGTYSWRVRDAASTQSSPVDRFVVAGVEGIFDRYHDDVDEEIVYPVNRSPLKVAVAASSERGGQKPVPDGWLDTIVRGLDRWNGIEPSFSFAYDGRCAIVSVPTADPADCNEEIPRPFVQVRSLGERGPLAVTQVTWDRALSGTHFTTADGINLLQGAIVSINDSYAARLWLGANAPASGSYDLESIVAHELGHVAGLGHDYTFPAATMHYRLQEGAMHRIPQQFDRASLRFLYGQSHGGALMPYVKPLQIAEQAALIVRGSTSGTPTLRVASTGELYHEHRFVVAEYLKGTGPAEILVRTPLDSRGNPYEGAATLTTPVEQVLALSTETLGAMDMSPGSAYYVTYWSAGAWWISSDGFAINQADSTFAEPLADLRDRISAVVAGGPDPHPLPGIPRYVIA